MRVSEVMTRDVRVANPNETIREAARIMAEIDAGVVPVGDDDRLVGMTSADLFGTTSIDTEGLTVADLDPAIVGPGVETAGSDLAQKEN